MVQVGNQNFQSVEVGRPKQKLGCAFLLLPLSGLIMLGVGLWFGYSSYDFYANGFEVEGTVVRLEESSDEDGISYSPVFSYRVDGQQFEYESVNASNPPSKRVGEATTLLVDPDDHGRARENSFWELWLLPVILIPVALFMLLLSMVIPVMVRGTG
jgi:hypothetical protein